MSVAISRSRAKAIATNGVGRVAFGANQHGITRLRDLYQADPVRVLFPHPPRDEIASAVFVTTSGGLVGGDTLSLSCRAGEGVKALCYPQAAEKIYRSTGAQCRIDLSLHVDPGAWLEWLPQETIMFDSARLVRTNTAEVAPGGRLLAGEITVLGRRAMGETMQHGQLRDDWSIRRDGGLIWADAFGLDGDIENTVAHPAGLAGASAFATIVYVADNAKDALSTARDLLSATPDAVRSGATLVNGVLLVRFLAVDPHHLRKHFGAFWAGFRQAVAGLPATLPRLWHI